MKPSARFQGGSKTYLRCRLVAYGLLVILLQACAAISPQTSATEQVPVHEKKLSTTVQPQQSYWWHVKIKVAWPEGQEPAWYMDILLARQIFKPLLLEHALDIEMWRFHRRAARDSAGHEFDFIFYSKPAAAKAIFSSLSTNSLIQNLIAAGKVEKMILYDGNKKPSPAIEATSDRNWSLEMQRAWPYYAMGVSQLLLSLTDQYVASALHNGENSPNEKNIEELAGFYRKINDKLVATWKNEGGHALLHHLDALFGYNELFVYERRLTRF
jgi:hypothetical protein